MKSSIELICLPSMQRCGIASDSDGRKVDNGERRSMAARCGRIAPPRTTQNWWCCINRIRDYTVVAVAQEASTTLSVLLCIQEGRYFRSVQFSSSTRTKECKSGCTFFVTGTAMVGWHGAFPQALKIQYNTVSQCLTLCLAPQAIRV